jgi:hypothetical protein
MKFFFWSLFFALILFPFFSKAVLFQSSVAFECNGICLEGSSVDWNISIRNLDNQTVTLKQFSFSDSDGLVFAQWAVNPIRFIPPGNEFRLAASGLVPPPVRGSTLYYRACFDFGSGSECENGWRTITVLPLSSAQCFEKNDCQLNEICQSFKCQPMVCPLGSTPDAHECSYAPSVLAVFMLTVLALFVIWRRLK